MRSIENTKGRISNIVSAYKESFPEEYRAVVEQMKGKRRLNNDEFGAARGDHAVKRKIYEIPEKLSIAFIKELTDEELGWFNRKENAYWFAQAYPEFKGYETF